MLLPREAADAGGNCSAPILPILPVSVPPESVDRCYSPSAVLRPQGNCESPCEKHRAPQPQSPKIRLPFGPAQRAPLETHGIAATTSQPECPDRQARTVGQIRLALAIDGN